MLENKNHKKISLSGKSLLMGTLSTAAIVLSASTANAATINADNVNENQTVEVTASSVNNENNKQVTEKDSADKSTSDVAEDANTKKSNENTETTEKNTQTVVTNAPVSDVKNTNTVTAETPVDKVVNNSDQKTTNAATTDTKKDDVKQVEKKDSVDKTNAEENKDSSVKPAENATKAELKGQVKDIVEESCVDTSKLTNDQINELNKINFSKEAKSGTQLTYNDFKKIAKTLIEQDARYAIPFFNASKIKNMPAAKTLDAQSGKVEDLEIWDS